MLGLHKIFKRSFSKHKTILLYTIIIAKAYESGLSQVLMGICITCGSRLNADSDLIGLGCGLRVLQRYQIHR